MAWGGGLGITPVDDEVLGVCHAATAVRRALGAGVEGAPRDFAGLQETADVSRGASMVARHADKLGKWRGVMQENLVKNIEYGLTLTATDIGRAERIRTALWHRVREFYTRYDLIVTPTTAVPPFPVAVVYPREINGKPMTHYIEWALLTYAFTVVGLPAISVASRARACPWGCSSPGAGGTTPPCCARRPPSRRRSRGRTGGRPSGGRQFPARLIRPSMTGAIVPCRAIASSTRSPSCGPLSLLTSAFGRPNSVHPSPPR